MSHLSDKQQYGLALFLKFLFFRTFTGLVAVCSSVTDDVKVTKLNEQIFLDIFKVIHERKKNVYENYVNVYTLYKVHVSTSCSALFNAKRTSDL